MRCSGGVVPETTVAHGTVSPVDTVHGENQGELLPDAQGRQPQLKLTHPACGRPPVRGEGNADNVSSRPLRLYRRRGLSTSLHPEASLHQDHKTPWPGTAAQHHISWLPSLAGKKQLLKTSRNNHTACYRTACSTSSHTVISSCGGPWGSYFITSCSKLSCFLLLIKEVKVSSQRFS